MAFPAVKVTLKKALHWGRAMKDYGEICKDRKVLGDRVKFSPLTLMILK